jgi:hypothetical protein
MSPDDLCENCDHRRELHRTADASGPAGCHYLHPHGGGCGSNGGRQPFGDGNTERCTAFVEPAAT